MLHCTTHAKPVVHCALPLARIKEPLQQLIDRDVFGKAVLIP